MYKKSLCFIAFSALLFVFSRPILAGCWTQCGVVGQREDGSNIDWCWDTCDGGSYPTNDGWHDSGSSGPVESPSDGVTGGWIDASGVGHDGASGVNGSEAKKDKGWDSAYVHDATVGSSLNCTTKPACSSQQTKDALNAYKNGAYGYKVGSATDVLATAESEGMDPQLLEDIKSGKVLVAAWTNDGNNSPFSNSFPIGWTSFIYIPAWVLAPPAVQQAQAAQGGAGYSAPPGVTYQSCRICENGNFKSEEVLTGTCKGTELNYCTDYHLNPEVDPIVQYRFPLCHMYPMPVGSAVPPTGKLATYGHPLTLANLTYTLKDVTGEHACTVEFVDSLGMSTTSPSPTDLQVVTCPVTISRVANQDIQIKSSGVTFPYQGFNAPIWATRDTIDLSSCANPGTDTRTMTPYGQHLMTIALPFTSPWIKVADGTYARSGAGNNTLINYLPGFVEPFNSSDKDTSSSLPHFLTSTGAGISLGTVNVGSVATISTTNWKVDGYTSTFPNTPTSLFKEIMQKKTYQEYTASNPPPSNLTLSQEITIIDTPTTYTLSSLAFNGGKSSYTLIIKNGSTLGNLTIDTASLNPTGTPALLIVANEITTSNPAATTIGAIIIANTFKTGTGDALHIKGNLSLVNPLIHQRVRADSDDRKPTIFIEFSPDMYLSLLPILGSTSREWSQVE